MTYNPKIWDSGEGAILLEMSSTIDEGVNRLLHKLKAQIQGAKIQGIRECVVAYSSMAIYFDPLKVAPDKLRQKLADLLDAYDEEKQSAQDLLIIPVAYGGAMGPDLPFVASNAGISEEEVVRRHSSRDYYCYMLGFTPGFPYLGGMDESIAAPRLSSPRQAIPAGSVGIAGKQTGIYSIESPGGWQLIGRTPLKLFDLRREDPTLIRPGDRIRFIPIEEEEFHNIAAQWENGTYQPTRIKGGDQTDISC